MTTSNFQLAVYLSKQIRCLDKRIDAATIYREDFMRMAFLGPGECTQCFAYNVLDI